jgi:hypothetical protein
VTQPTLTVEQYLELANASQANSSVLQRHLAGAARRIAELESAPRCPVRDPDVSIWLDGLNDDPKQLANDFDVRCITRLSETTSRLMEATANEYRLSQFIDHLAAVMYGEPKDGDRWSWENLADDIVQLKADEAFWRSECDEVTEGPTYHQQAVIDRAALEIELADLTSQVAKLSALLAKATR